MFTHCNYRFTIIFCDNPNSSPVLIPVYLGSANPMTQRNSTAINALTNMQIGTGMSHVCLCFHPIAASHTSNH